MDFFGWPLESLGGWLGEVAEMYCGLFGCRGNEGNGKENYTFCGSEQGLQTGSVLAMSRKDIRVLIITIEKRLWYGGIFLGRSSHKLIERST